MQKNHARADVGAKAAPSRKPAVDAFDPHFPLRSLVIERTPDAARSQIMAYDPHFRPMRKR